MFVSFTLGCYNKIPLNCRHRQLFLFRRRFPSQKCHPGDHQHPEGLAAGAPEEPLPHKGGEDNACYHHQDDPHTSKNYSLTKEILIHFSLRFLYLFHICLTDMPFF